MSDLADPTRWEASDRERERYILYMLGNYEAARRFWEEWLPDRIKEEENEK